MAYYSIIENFEVASSDRLDSEFYKPSYIKIFNILKRNSKLTLGDISNKITQGPNPIFSDIGKACLNGRNIASGWVNLFEPNHISDEEFEQYSRFCVKKGDILITLKGKGSIGKIGLATRDLEAIFSRDIGLIRLKDKAKSAIVFAFLKSYWGKNIIERGITGGTGQLTLTTTYLKNIYIPDSILNKDKINNLVEEAHKTDEEAKNLIAEAENIYIKSIGLLNWKIPKFQSFIVESTEIDDHNRIDSEFYNPKYEAMLKEIKTSMHPVEKKVDLMKASIDPKKSPNKAIRYIELADIDSVMGTVNTFTEITGKEAPSRARMLLKEGDVIASSVAGSIDKVALMTKSENDFVASTGFLKMRAKGDISPEVLFIYAKSIALKLQLEKEAAGAILSAVPKDSIKNLVFPEITEYTQKDINFLVRKSREKHIKVIELLKESSSLIENILN
jgi:hypothetical protein